MGDWGKSGIIRFFGKIEDLSMVKKLKVKLKAQSKAQSNENTQNPKGNQEKMANEGIQEHSEHTAENKQPESKDDVQNKNKLTRLCNFFKKLWNGDVQEKNKNSKKAEENAAKNNDAAKQAEMQQADTVVQPKEQIKLTGILEIISKILGISAILGTFSGGFFIYKYLKNIGQLSIFPDVITNPSALIATAIIFGGIALYLYFKFFVAFLVGINTKSGQGWNTLKPILGYLIFYLVSYALDYFVLYPLISDKLAFLSFLLYMLAACLLVLSISIDNDYKKNKIIFLIICLIPIYLIFINFFPSNQLSLYSANFVRFVETHENSSWYLLHNNFQQNNGSQEINGINKSDLKALKKRFYSNLCTEKGLKEHTLQYYSTPASRENALYGYMAWNLGDTKVFCPSYVNNKFSNINNQITDNCIVISGKALQIMPEGYISTEPIQQPKHDAKEYKIEINCCNCNHDSSKNEDNHPDIGYTDKKICQ